MRIVVAAAGGLGDGAERILFDDYMRRASRLSRSAGMIVESRALEVSSSRSSDRSRRRLDDLRALERRVSSLGSSAVWARLEPTGEAISSEGFARRLSRFRGDGVSALAFLVGGADGLAGESSSAVSSRTSFSLSLGLMTWPHRLARVMLAEQLYRALSRLAATPYHRG